MKILDGRELAGFIKERQAQQVREMRSRKVFPKLLIIRDSDNPVIVKYVELKKRYGEDIGVTVEDLKVSSIDEAKEAVLKANKDATVSGMIVQLPLTDAAQTDSVVNLIAPEKDVDGLSAAVPDEDRKFESATATAINWLLAGHDVELSNKRIALVGRGRLVGAPLLRMWKASGLDVSVFQHNSDLSLLSEYDVIVTATGAPHLVSSKMVRPGAVVVDAGTASEDGVLVGDVDMAVRERTDLSAITPVSGGVGPLTIAVLFEHVLSAAK